MSTAHPKGVVLTSMWSLDGQGSLGEGTKVQKRVGYA
jgi:hypothetical protein